jgi:subtilisin family serine protease
MEVPMANPTAVQAYTTVWLITCLLIFQPVTVDSETFKTLKHQHPPGRKTLPASLVNHGHMTNSQAVFMHHSAFLMNPAYIPRQNEENTHVLIQLKQPLSGSMETELHLLDVYLYEYIPNNTWKAVIPWDRLAEIQSLPGVRAIGDIRMEDKLSRGLMEQYLMAIQPDEEHTLVDLLITFHDDIPFERAREIARVFHEDLNQDAYLSGNRIRVSMAALHLAEIAAYDEVSWIEAGGRIKRAVNCDAARLSNVDRVQFGDYELDGQGVVMGQWDGGAVDRSHPDLSEQVTIHTDTGVSSHATGVAGTLVGRGECKATGMAPGASLHSFYYRPDVPSQMKTAKHYDQIIIANHSWVYETGWAYNPRGDKMWAWFGSDAFGNYSQHSAAWDNVIRHKGVISVNGAGNDRGEGFDRSGEAHYHENWDNRLYYDSHPQDGPYGCISDIGSAKNVITVGAVDDKGHMTEFSSWGPTNDGRIKPDLVANGVGLTTTNMNDHNEYMTMTGTSSATPVVSGATALLVQAYQQIMDQDPSPAMVKALLVNTAADLGQTGPDYQYGWGLVDLRDAVDTLNAPAIFLNENTVSSHMDMTYTYTVNVSPGTPELKVTVVWSDREGSPSAGKALVNDIDLSISDPEDVVYEPWVLDGENPGYPAGTGVNRVDNVEQVLVPWPREGEWKVRVKGAQIQVSQDYAVVSNVALQPVVIDESVFQVDTGDIERQACPSISSGYDRLFLLVWSEWKPGEDGWDIHGQYFEDTGIKHKEEFTVNTYTLQDQIKPMIVTLPTPRGNTHAYVVIWASLGQDGDGYGVFGQHFNLVGERIGDEFQVNTYFQGDQKHASMAALKSGGYVIAWTSNGQDGSGLGIFAQRFDADGIREGNEFQVNTFSDHDQSHPSVAMLEDGGFVITWHSQNQDGDDWEIFGQRFDSQGQRNGTEFQLNATTRYAQQSPAIQSISNNVFMAAWTSECENNHHMDRDIHIQRFGYDGGKIGSEFRVNPQTDLNLQDPSVSVLKDSGFMVTWSRRIAPENRWEIHGQLFDTRGAKQGKMFQLAAYNGGEQSFYSMDLLSCGKYVVTWCSGSEQTEYKGIYGRQFVVIDKPYIDITADDPGDDKGCMVELLAQ